MKKIISVSLFSILVFFKIPAFGQGQSAYYDAKFIYDECFDKDDGVFKNKVSLYDVLLKKYYPSETALSESKLKENPFFRPFVPAAIAQSINESNYQQRGGSMLSNLDVTNIADGLAQFLIKRGREELNVAFFNQLKEFLNDEKHEECQVLFPETIDLLNKIDSYKYAAFLENLRNAFHTDLNNLIIHLNQVIDLPKYESIPHHTEIKLVLGTANIASELSQSGKSIMPDSVIKQLAFLPWDSVSRNLGNSLKLLNLISQSIKADTSLHQSWVPLSDLNTYLFTDSITLRIFFGLLYQQAQNEQITFYGKNQNTSIRVDTLLARQKDNIFRLSGLIQNFSLLADDVQNTIADYKAKKDSGSLNNDDNYTYISKAINIINYGFTVANTFKIESDIKSQINHDKYINVARNANELYKNIYTKNYNSAVLNVCSILDSLLPGKQEKLISGVLKYGNFMASVVKAESPGEVQSAIEATVLPAGSSSIKKNSAFNISLNAYIGGYFGKSNTNATDFDGSNSKVGVTAPVGVAFSVGLGHFKNGASIGSLSLYGTLIDVGAIAGYRLNDDNTALEQKITLGDIFTPGGYLVYGIGLPFLSYVPLSVGYGWQYGSRLYNKEDGKISISNSSRWRSNWFVGIDIPLANFLTKNYK
jgi:hypothetical protein